MQRIVSRFCIWICAFALCAQTVLGAELVAGGQIIGLEVQDQTVCVAAFDETYGGAAKKCGLKIGDRIAAINGSPVNCAQDVKNALLRTDGKAELTVLRNGKLLHLTAYPEISTEGPRLGVYLKQGVTGVGTVTWYDPESQTFGALGHGVNDPDGKLVNMTKGRVFQASVVTVRQGKAGEPGQLMSSVTGNGVIGSLEKNTHQGVFGKAELSSQGTKVPVGSREDVKLGPAVIRSTVSGRQVQEYSVEILKIYPNAGPSGRNMLLKITDSQLLATTGGIVQGMGVSYNKDNQWNP